MTDLEKRREGVREKVEDLEKRHDALKEEVREAGGKLDGDRRAKLEQIQLDMQKAQEELEEIRQQEADEKIQASVEEMRNGFSEPEPQSLGERAVQASDRTENLEQLRNSHPAFRDWTHFGDFLGAICRKEKTGEVDKRLAPWSETRAPTGFGELIDSDGGHLIPPQFASELLRLTWQTGAVSSRCRRIPMTAPKIVFPAVDETSRVTGSRFGGVQAYWLAEAESVTASKGKFKKVTLEPKKLGAAVYATDEILQDTTALGAFINMAFPEEMSFTVEDAIWEGDGSGKPLGITQSAAIISVTKETGQAAATIVAENIIKMRARLWARSRGNSVWFTNQDIDPQLHTMSLPVGTGGVPVYLPAGGLAGAENDTLYGRPVIPVEYASTLGTVGDIVLADMSHYLLGQLGGVQTATSIHVNFLKFEQVFRFALRVDGQPWWSSAVTPFKGTAAQSPFIQLATRA